MGYTPSGRATPSESGWIKKLASADKKIAELSKLPDELYAKLHKSQEELQTERRKSEHLRRTNAGLENDLKQMTLQHDAAIQLSVDRQREQTMAQIRRNIAEQAVHRVISMTNTIITSINTEFGTEMPGMKFDAVMASLDLDHPQPIDDSQLVTKRPGKQPKRKRINDHG